VASEALLKFGFGLYAYVGPKTLAAMAREWGVDLAALPGGEVDPGLLERVTKFIIVENLRSDRFPPVLLGFIWACCRVGRYAYVGPKTLAAMAREWGVDLAALPGGEVDPGLLQIHHRRKS
jgi:hypothetical protein